MQTPDFRNLDWYGKRGQVKLPKHLVGFAQEKGPQVGVESRGFMSNAEAAEIVDFFDIGTRASQLR